MYQGIRPLVTTGVALVGASVIAVSPISVPQAEIHDPPLPAATQRVVEMSDVQLAGLAEDLERFVEAAINAPAVAALGIGSALNGLPEALDNASSTREAIGLLATAVANIYASPIRAALDPLVVNASPYDPVSQDFIDATLLAVRDLVDDPLFIPTIPLSFLSIWGEFGFTPFQAAGLIATGYAMKPFSLAAPYFAAFANTFPAPLGGDLTSGDPEDWGTVFQGFDEAYTATQNFLLGIFMPQQMVAQKQGVAKIEPVDTWPPNAQTVRMSLDTLGDNLRTLPGDLRLELTRDRNTVVAYLDQGRPLDAVRFLASRAIVFSLGQASSYAGVAATLAPPPLGQLSNGDDGLILGGFTRIGRAGLDLADEIAPDPVKITASKQIAPSGINAPQGNSGNIMTLNIPDPRKNVEEFTNVGISQGADNKDGTTVTKIDNNRPKIGSNVRAVVREVRNDIRQTVRDVRQGVHDVVKAVTGLGKKKDDAPKTEAAKSE